MMNVMRWSLCIFAVFMAAAPGRSQQVLKPGDVVVLACKEESSLDGEYTVSASGLVNLPLIGAVEVRGLTEDQAAQKVSKTLVAQQILRIATVSVKLKARDSLPVTFGGAVRNPGEILLAEGMRLGDVLKIAQPTASADLTAIRLAHADGSVENVDFTKKEGDVLLKPGDRVFVPLKVAGREITVLGAVARPGIVAHWPGMKVSDAVREAGGLRADGDGGKVLVRFSAGGSAAVNITLAESDVALSPGDQVTVPIRAATEYVYVRGAIRKPGLIPYSPGLTLLAAVGDADPVEGARLDRVTITRKEANQKSRRITANVDKIVKGTAQDEPLLPGDVVEVPYPSKSYSVENASRIIGIALLVYLLLK